MRVRELLGAVAREEQEQPTPLLLLPRCDIGMEYEWENTREYSRRTKKEAAPGGGQFNAPQLGIEAPQALKDAISSSTYKQKVVDELDAYYNAHVDGSLRKGGMEYTFMGPYTGSRVIKAIEVMDEAQRVLSFEGSYRTSLHVHISVHDLRFPQGVEQIGALYCLVEPFFYKFVGERRDSSNYCVPWYVHPQSFDTFFACVEAYAKSPATKLAKALQQHKGNKYSGLNMFSLGDYGTMEFRQAPVTMQKDKIITWLNLIMSLKHWVSKNSMSTSDLVVHVKKQGPVLFLQEVFGPYYREVVKMSRDIPGDFWQGMLTLYQFIASNNQGKL